MNKTMIGLTTTAQKDSTTFSSSRLVVSLMNSIYISDENSFIITYICMSTKQRDLSNRRCSFSQQVMHSTTMPVLQVRFLLHAVPMNYIKTDAQINNIFEQFFATCPQIISDQTEEIN